MGTSQLKVILAKKDMRINELAYASGVSYSACKAIVNGRKPTIDNAYAISEALGLHIDRVFPNLYNYSTLQKNRRKKAQ